ncbi:hypothetical protein IAI18_01525 [Acetobacteraceae bacterium H6797]|nr:hypothetical protein [Acetobacteraceae bacterium H6797]
MAGPAFAQVPDEPAPGDARKIGSWRLACATDQMTDKPVCRLIHQQWIEPPGPGHAGLVLEVIQRHGQFIPAVTSRELTLMGAARGLLALSGTAQLRFPPKPMAEAPCALEGRSVICAPTATDTPRLAEELRASPRLLVRVQGLANETGEVPMNLPLAETEAAIAAFRAGLPAGEAAPEPPGSGFDLRWLVQRFRDFFFQ